MYSSPGGIRSGGAIDEACIAVQVESGRAELQMVYIAVQIEASRESHRRGVCTAVQVESSRAGLAVCARQSRLRQVGLELASG